MYMFVYFVCHACMLHYLLIKQITKKKKNVLIEIKNYFAALVVFSVDQRCVALRKSSIVSREHTFHRDSP